MKTQIATCVFVLAGASAAYGANEGVTLFSAEKSAVASGWRTVNDGVMGGRSVGRLSFNGERHLQFYGRLSLANNGGFASVRTNLRGVQLQSSDAIVLRVRGDGRTYNFNLYAPSGRSRYTYSYRRSFPTRRGEWTEVRIPVRTLVATWRGRTFPNEKLDPSRITGIGILLGDKKPGEFQLEVERISVEKATS